jgi:hypothetical protein
LRAHGARVAAFDLDAANVARAKELGAEAGLAEGVAVELTFGDGSVGQILYTASGAYRRWSRITVRAPSGEARSASRYEMPARATRRRSRPSSPPFAPKGQRRAALETLLAVTRATFAVHRDVAGATHT